MISILLYRKLFILTISMLLLMSSGTVYGKGRTKGILPGASAKDPLTVDAATLDFFDKEQKLIYNGDVLVVNGPSTLKASRLIIFLDDEKNNTKKTTGNDRVKHIDAQGPVKLVTKDQISIGDNGSYDKSQNKVYLTGNVKITQNETVVTGDRAIYDVATGESSVFGNDLQGGKVRSTLTPQTE